MPTTKHRTANKDLAAERKRAEEEQRTRKRGAKRRRPAAAEDRRVVERAAKLAPHTPTWPLQVVRIRRAIKARPDLASGGLSKKSLRAYAKGEPIQDDLSKLRALGQMTGDPYCSGRRLAAALVALGEEREVAEKGGDARC